MSVLDDVIARLRSGIASFTGDEPLVAAAVSAATLVITADGEIAQEEVETALADLMTEPTLGTNYPSSALATELRLTIERACTVAGKEDNLAMVSAIGTRAADQRNNVLLVAIDVAMAHRGISETEERVLTDLAGRLDVDKGALTEAATAQRLVTNAGLDLRSST